MVYYVHTSSNEAQDAAFGPLCPPILGGPEFQSPPILGDLGGHREQVLQLLQSIGTVWLKPGFLIG
jgi:hypothetical protein